MRAGAADVDEGAQRQQRIGGDLADAALRPRLGQHLREIGALERAARNRPPRCGHSDRDRARGRAWRSSSSTEGNQGLSRQLALTTIAPSGFFVRKKSSIASDLPPRIPARPQLRAFAADGRAQQRQTARAQILRLVDPGDPKTFQRLDRVRGVILHAPEDDDAVAGRFDLVADRP